MIRLEGVTKRYRDGTVAVDDLTLEAAAGELTVLVGPSGCGKTTTLRMINRMVEPTSGRILLDGQDTSRIPAAQLRRGIGYVIQHGGLFPHRTVLANVMTVPLLLGWSRERARQRARDMLELVGLSPDLASRYPSQLSGGQQQRVGVARALAGDPRVILMDEPFSAVDPVVRTGLQDELVRLQRELGTTIVFVTHDIEEAIKLGDRIAVLRVGGRLAQFSTPAELLAHPADDFVADFVGRDRGYRALSFVSAPVPVHPEDPVRLGDALTGRADEWALVVDDDQHPLGWAHRDDGVAGTHRGQGTPRPENLRLGGTLAPTDAPLRAMLDAALSSPSGRGVLVDPDGRRGGTVRASEVLSVIEAQEIPGR
jgi:osmoprotectant transport system ATP-binding protein